MVEDIVGALDTHDYTARGRRVSAVGQAHVRLLNPGQVVLFVVHCGWGKEGVVMGRGCSQD